MTSHFKTRHTPAVPKITVTNGGLMALLFGLLSGLWMAAQAQESALPRFQPEDVFALEFAADPQIAPDGDRVAYERVSMDIMTDRAGRGIWLVDINGQAHEPLVSGPGKYTSPRWSPEGDRLAYLAKEAGQTQLRIRWLESGADINITSLLQSPYGLTWSPDGRSIAFTRLVPRVPEQLSTMPDKPKQSKTIAKNQTILTNIQLNGIPCVLSSNEVGKFSGHVVCSFDSFNIQVLGASGENSGHLTNWHMFTYDS